MKRIARRYAKALFELAVEQQKLDDIASDMESVSSVLEENEELRNVLSNPLVSVTNKYRVLQELFSERLDGLTSNFLLMVTEKKRIGFLNAIIGEFRRFVREHRNLVEGDLISAVSLDEEQVDKIQDHIETLVGKSVVLNEKIDGSIVGGFVVKVQDLVIDNSIRSQLNKLREKLIADG